MNFVRYNTILLDLQFINGNNKQLFVKEICYMHPDMVHIEHIVLKPPYPEEELDDKTKNQIDYCYENINGFRWNDGTIDYLELNLILNGLKDFLIIVKGIEKKKFLQKYLPNTRIYDLDMKKSLSKFFNYRTKCYIHEDQHLKRCAIANVMKLFVFLEKNDLLI
jgi:hypothetical protein